MDHQTVKKLELELEEAIVEALKQIGARQLPLTPSPHTMHLMAKAAVTVFEAAVENAR